ncbi:MAG: HEAT repeat domain-containing protein, partial [Candidatus Hydrogenedentes bacterium]|nr:HEAT repeat domain-containing protein [Candidatus Hydrogenedentota bacterium]
NESPRTRQGAALALGRLGDPRAAAPLTACLKDQDEAVRSQVERALKEMELKPFIEKGTHMLDVASADLNGDGTTDYILVLENQWQKPEELRIEEGPRPLLILLRDAVGRLKSVKRNDKMIGSTETLEGADDFGGVEAGVKTFTVHHGGSYGNGQAWSTAYTFNYSRIDKTWQLVKAEEYRGQRSNEEEINEVYTPPKDYGKIDIADFDPATYLWKGER